MEVEEGELSSSDESKDLELENVDYHVLERPKILPTSYATGNPPVVNRLDLQDYDNVELNSNQSDSSDSSDDDFQPTRSKKRMSNPNTRMDTGKSFVNPNVELSTQPNPVQSSAMDSSSFEGKAAIFQTGRKKINNVWGDVLREQSVSSTADDLGLFMVGGEDAQVFKRGPESFVIEGNLKRKYKAEGDVFDAPLEDPDTEETFSETGLSDDSKEFILSNSMELKAKANPPIANKKKYKERVRRLTLSMSNEEFCSFVANQLEERKVSIISNVVKYLGREVVLHLFSKTLLIEKRGGILIKNGIRRRTPGGVFLYLLRNNSSFDRDIISKIFDEGDAECARVRIEAKRRKKHQSRSTEDKERSRGNCSPTANVSPPVESFDSAGVGDMN